MHTPRALIIKYGFIYIWFIILTLPAGLKFWQEFYLPSLPAMYTYSLLILIYINMGQLRSWVLDFVKARGGVKIFDGYIIDLIWVATISHTTNPHQKGERAAPSVELKNWMKESMMMGNASTACRIPRKESSERQHLLSLRRRHIA